MKYKFLKFGIFASCVSMMLVGCGTVGGAIGGAGQDLQKAGNWIKNQ
jgi:predicted small secreted protein